MKQLTDKKALVTGAGTGLGKAMAIELGRRGAHVCVHYSKSKEGAEETADIIRKAGAIADIISADLGDVDQAQQLVQTAIEHMDGIDILINNAGMTNTMRFTDVTPDDFNELFNVNFRGMFFCAQAAIKYMRNHKRGAIINISSVHAMNTLPGYSIYAPSKGAIVSFTKQLAIEVARLGIRVNCIIPGCILVEADYRKNPDLSETEIGNCIPCGFTGQPEDIGKMAAFLASDEAKYITGSIHVVDGGLLAALAFSTPEAVY